MEILNFLFPKNCLNCRKNGRYICLSCLDKVPYSPERCVQCKRLSLKGASHQKCLSPLSLDGMTCLWRYQGVIRQALIKLKYRFVSDVAKELVENIDSYLGKNKTLLPENPVLVTIPLHQKRAYWRGFNQAEEIGKRLAAKYKWPYIDNLLIRKKHTKPQVELKAKFRKQNVSGVFLLNNKYHPDRFKDKTVVIFDDVFTTGATIKEAAKVLKRGGIKKVWGLTIAG